MSRTTDVIIKAQETPWLLTPDERKFCGLDGARPLARKPRAPWYPALECLEPTPAIEAAARAYLAADLEAQEARRTELLTGVDADYCRTTAAMERLGEAKYALDQSLGNASVWYRVGDRVFGVAYRMGWRAGREVLIRPAYSNRFSAGLRRIALSYEDAGA